MPARPLALPPWLAALPALAVLLPALELLPATAGALPFESEPQEQKKRIETPAEISW